MPRWQVRRRNITTKVPSKFADYSREDFLYAGFRVVPPAMYGGRRHSSRKNAVLMPSYVNIGPLTSTKAPWSTPGPLSVLAQIAENVPSFRRARHRRRARAAAGQSTIIEGRTASSARDVGKSWKRDRQEGSVISWACSSGQEHQDLITASAAKYSYGRVPAGSVVVSALAAASDGKCNLYCAVIVQQVDAKTRAKTSINDLLRSD